MIFWGIIMILVLSVVPFLFLNNWLNLIKTYNKSISLKLGMYILISIVIYLIISIKFGFKNIDDLVFVADNFFKYIKNSFIFKCFQNDWVLPIAEKLFKSYFEISVSVFAVTACISNIFMLYVCYAELKYNFEEKDGTCSIVLQLSLSVIFAITTVLMFVFKENDSIISLMLLILFSTPLLIRIIKAQHKWRIYVLKHTAILSLIFFSLIFCWRYVIYAWIFLAFIILATPFCIGGGGGGSKPKPTYLDELEKQSKKISAIQGELYDGEWIYKDGYITDGFSKRKVIDSDIHGKVITDEYGQKHIKTHSSEIDD